MRQRQQFVYRFFNLKKPIVCLLYHMVDIPVKCISQEKRGGSFVVMVTIVSIGNVAEEVVGIGLDEMLSLS